MTILGFRARAWFVLCFVGQVAGCGSQASEPGPVCVAEALEADASTDGFSPENWPVLPQGAVVASTYLRLASGGPAEGRFNELMMPIQAELSAPAPGLLALAFTRSTVCGTARTLSAWQSEEAMTRFVVGRAHAEAIGNVSDVSRGGSITGHWPASRFTKIGWTEVIALFSGHAGPEY